MENQRQWAVLIERAPVAVAFSLLLTLGHASAEQPEMDLALPPMVVAGLSDDQPWQYTQVDDSEVLTLCGSELTGRFLTTKRRSRLFLPKEFQMKGTRAAPYILYDQLLAHDAPKPAGWRQLPDAVLGPGWRRVTNMEGENDRILATNMFGVSDWPELSMGHATILFDNVRPQGPEWLREGLLGEHGALSGLASYRKTLKLARLTGFAWDTMAEVEKVLRDPEEGHGLLALRDLFESPSPDDPELRWRWMLQAALFCRWQIYSPEGQRNGGHGFWNWARLARKGPVDEKAFEACVGFNYAQAESRMLKYLHRFIGIPVDVPIRLYPLADEISLRPATELEIARLLGEFQWQEAKRLREEGDWEQALKYESAARRTYQRGLSRTKGHAQLQAGLGLLEFEGGCSDEARILLEKAFEGKGADGRALLALARLRFEEAKATVGSEGLFNAAQIGFVLNPLFAARAEVPVDMAVYRLIGEVWSRSAFTAEEKHLNVLLEGVANYPHDLELALQVAEVHVRHGHREIARVVATRGETLAGRSRHRAKFETLLAGLERP